MLTNTALSFVKMEYLWSCSYISKKFFDKEHSFDLVIVNAFITVSLKTDKVSH